MNNHWRGKPPVQYCPTSGKVMYDKKGATTAKNARYKQSHALLRVYQCPDCNTWHLTHTKIFRGTRHKRDRDGY